MSFVKTSFSAIAVLLASFSAFAQQNVQEIPVEIHGDVKPKKEEKKPLPKIEDMADLLLQAFDPNKSEEEAVKFENVKTLRDMSLDMDAMYAKTIIGISIQEIIFKKNNFCYSVMAPITAFAERTQKSAEHLLKAETLHADFANFAEQTYKQSLFLKNYCTSTIDPELKRIPRPKEVLEAFKTIRNTAKANKMIIQQELYEMVKPIIEE